MEEKLRELLRNDLLLKVEGQRWATTGHFLPYTNRVDETVAAAEKIAKNFELSDGNQSGSDKPFLLIGSSVSLCLV